MRKTLLISILSLWLGACQTQAAIFIDPLKVYQSQSQQQVKLKTTQQVQLHARVILSNGEFSPAIHWQVANPEVASIDSEGILTGLRPGKTEAIASASSEPSQQTQVEILVEAVAPETFLSGEELFNTFAQLRALRAKHAKD